jgi:hypothetical protein
MVRGRRLVRDARGPKEHERDDDQKGEERTLIAAARNDTPVAEGTATNGSFRKSACSFGSQSCGIALSRTCG